LASKAHLLGNASLLSPSGVVCPLLGQVKSAVDEGRSFLGGVAEEHPNLGVLLFSGGPCVLRSHPHGLLSLLQEAGLIDDEYPASLIFEVFHDVLTEVSSRTASGSQRASLRRCCTPLGLASPMASAICQEFLRLTSASSPVR
jgi:hypothetical protein